MTGEYIKSRFPIRFAASALIGVWSVAPCWERSYVDSSQAQDSAHVCGWIGVEAWPMNAETAESLNLAGPYGAILGKPVPDSPAERAGIQQYDVITAIGDSTLSRASDFASIISGFAPGTAVYLNTWRNRQPMRVKLVLESGPCAKS
jgi:serine protease Do